MDAFIIKPHSVDRFTYQGSDHLWSIISERQHNITNGNGVVTRNLAQKQIKSDKNAGKSTSVTKQNM